MKGKDSIFLVGFVIIISIAIQLHGLDDVDWLSDVKGTFVSKPLVVKKPDCGFFIFWEEILKPDEMELGVFPWKRYFYRMVDSKGKIVINKNEIIEWYLKSSDPRSDYKFNPHTVIWIDSTQLMLIASFSGLNYRGSERLILNSKGNIVLGPESFKENIYIPPESQLVKDSKGRVYMVNLARVPILEIMQVYPHLGKIIATPKRDLNKFYKYGRTLPAKYLLSLYKAIVTITSENKLLICNRLGWGNEREPKGWPKRPNDLFYVLADLKGNIISRPTLFDITKTAYRRIPGIRLGGGFGSVQPVSAVDDLDFTTLPNGEIILSVTGLDKKSDLCTYQVKFTEKGELVKSDEIIKIEPREFPKDYSLPVAKVGIAVIAVEKGKIRYEYILYGFDEEGNFYEDRMVWKEEER